VNGPTPPEPALEVGAPDAVRFVGVRQRLRVRLGAAARLACNHQPRPFDDLPHGAGCRPPPPRLIPLQHTLQLAPAPAHVRRAQIQHCLLHLGCPLVGVLPGCPVQFCQALQPILPVAAKPYIAGVTAYAQPRTPLAHGLLIALILKDKAKLLVHPTARFPGHEDVVRPHP